MISAHRTDSSSDVAIVGGGVIGLAIARALAGSGLDVVVLERGPPGREASWAAAGMLCPRLESRPGSALAELGRRSLALYRDFANGLRDETEIDIDLRLDGVLASDPDELPPDVGRPLGPEELVRIEPAASPHLTRATFVAEEGSVDNRALTRALLRAADRRAVRLVSTEALCVETTAGRVTGVRTRDGVLHAEVVVNAAGAWAGALEVPGVTTDVQPVKGQMLCLVQSPDAPARLEHTIYSHLAYVVPRSDGRVVVGTTVEHRGFDKSVDADRIEALRMRAIGLAPSLASAAQLEAWAGLRPRGSDEAPTLGPVGPSGYFLATGHFRNGILLTPITAQEIEAAVLVLR